ncbi:hypothetical protein D3C81_1120170 [compost metagenome]
MPAFVLAAAMQARGTQFTFWFAIFAVLIGEDQRIVLANHFILGVAEDQRSARVPIDYQALFIKQDDGEVMGALRDQAHALLTLAQAFFGCAAFGDINERQHGAIDILLAGPVR